MPNWCDNELFITGAPEDVAALACFVRGDTELFCFNRVIPVPEEISAEDTHDWCIAHWGVKWPILEDAVQMRRTWDSVSYAFETAWAAPLPVIYRLLELYPQLTIVFRCVEPNMNFAGELKGGELKEGKIEDFEWAKARYPQDAD